MVLMLYHSHTIDEVFDEFKTSEKGLHQIYAEARLAQYGQNHLKLTRRSLWQIISEPFIDVLMLVLLATLAISIVSAQYNTVILLAIVISLNAAVRYIQGISEERTLRQLEHQATGHTVVRRDGIEVRINPIELVPGDIVLLQQGDRVPADGRVIHELQLRVNQLQLNGETDPVDKHNKPVHSESSLFDRNNMVYRGSYVTSGSGQFVVTATGNSTEYGKLTQKVSRIAKRSTLQQKINDLTHKIVILILIVAIVLLLVGIARGMSLDEALQYATAITAASVPVILPVAVAIAITKGLRSMSRHHALARNMQALEFISMISTILTDKTGILTRESLSLSSSWHPGMSNSSFEELCRRSAIAVSDESDEIDTSIFRHVPHKVVAHQVPAKIFGFEHSLALSGNLWHLGAQYQLTLKGAPEKILRMSELTDSEREQATHKLHELAAQGNQVIAIAHTNLHQQITQLSKLPKHQPLQFAGFIALQSTPVASSKQTIAKLALGGISVRMFTGDHIETAYTISRQLGIAQSHHDIFDSRKLAVMHDSELGRAVTHSTVFARATHTQKHLLIAKLRRSGVVAVTGRSADDIPALLQAQVGVSTAHSPVLVRDASDLILLDNKLATVTEAIKWSRTTLGNIRRMFLYLMTTNIGEMAIIAGSLLIGLAPAMLPAQIIWINLVTSFGLALPLGLEPHSRNIMKRKPVSPRASVLPRYLIIRMCILAASMTVMSIGAFIYYSQLHTEAYAQTIVFYMFIGMQIVSALSARSDHTSTLVRFRTFSPLIYVGICFTLLTQLLVITTPLGSWLGLVTVSISDALMTSAAAFVALLLISEVLKLYSRRVVRRKGRSY